MGEKPVGWDESSSPTERHGGTRRLVPPYIFLVWSCPRLEATLAFLAKETDMWCEQQARILFLPPFALEQTGQADSNFLEIPGFNQGGVGFGQ